MFLFLSNKQSFNFHKLFCCFCHQRSTFISGATGRSAGNGVQSDSNSQTTVHLAGANTSAQAQSNGDVMLYCSSFCKA